MPYDNRFAELLNKTTPGVPISAAELRDRFCISAQLSKYYVDKGFLRRLGAGVFCLPNDPITIYGALVFLQNKEPGLHVAGKSALAQRGISHNIYFRETMVVWGKSKSGLPQWVHDNFAARYSSARIFKFDDQHLDQLTCKPDPFCPLQVRCSCVERALLELLSEVGTKESWEEAKNIFDLILSVREEVLGPLLQACTSLKVKRLFATWAEETNLVNVPELFSAFNISLGNGKQWHITTMDGGRTTIRKVKTSCEHVPKKTQALHPALLRAGPAGLKPKKCSAPTPRKR